MPPMNLPGVLFLLLALLQDPTSGDLIRKLSQEAPQVREEATKELVALWKQWNPSDLAHLDQTTHSRDAEVAARAKACLAAIHFSRSIPEAIWKVIPDVGPVLYSGSPDAVANLADRMSDEWNKGVLSAPDLLPLLLLRVDDQRETARVRCTREGRLFYSEVGSVVLDLVHEMVPRLHTSNEPNELRRWWERNRGNPERDWLVTDLEAEDEFLRAEAVGRLFMLRQADLYPKLFTVLKNIKEDAFFERALHRARTLQPEILKAHLFSYLKDPRLSRRFSAAKTLSGSELRPAIDAIIDACENPEQMQAAVLLDSHLEDVMSWLVGTKDDRANMFVRQLLNTGNRYEKRAVLDALGKCDKPWADQALFEALADPERIPLFVGDVRDPRVCDLAAMSLAWRMKLDSTHPWRDPISERNANVELVWTHWRVRNGLPPAPWAPPGVSPIPARDVDLLIPDLVADDRERARRALEKLSTLGAGAWPHLQRHLGHADGASIARLQDSTRVFGNTLRRVEANADAEALVKPLRERLHEPFDVTAFIRDIGDTWYSDPERRSLYLEISREGEGYGISLKVHVEKGKPNTGTPGWIRLMSESIGGGFVYSPKKFFDETLEKLLAPLREDIRTGSQRHFSHHIVVTQKWEAEPQTDK